MANCEKKDVYRAASRRRRQNSSSLQAREAFGNARSADVGDCYYNMANCEQKDVYRAASRRRRQNSSSLQAREAFGNTRSADGTNILFLRVSGIYRMTHIISETSAS
jgi:hypothetical protein